MFTRWKMLRVAVPFLIVASILTTASPSASAAPPTNGYYGCNSGSYESSSSGSGRYQISSGSVTNGSSCAGAVVIPDGVTSFGFFAFYPATLMTSITIPNSVNSIGYGAFAYTSSLTSITIPNSVTSIGMFAFLRATSLASLTIPDSVTSLGSEAFGNTTSLTQYTYCGTSLTQTTLNNAGLNGKTKNCAPVYVYVPPMLPGLAPSISINNGVITCTIGEYSMAATSVAFSLFVDGTHVATNFSATGNYLPDWLAPWAAASTIQRTASLTSASWNIGLVGNGKKATCSTLAYSNHATGLISSKAISLP